jgi:glutathione S-transferase
MKGGNAMILLGASVSPFVRKVLVVAAEKNIPLDHRQVSPTTSDDPLFLSASPFRKIPALVDGDFQISDSTAIVNYLEALHPEPPVIPVAPRERAKAIWFEEFADTILFPVEVKIFFNRVVAPKFLGRAGNAVEADEAQGRLLPPLYAYLEKVLPGSGYIAGSTFSIGDIAVSSMLTNMSYCGAGVDAAQHPRLAAYYAGIAARPSFARFIAADRAALSL